jgi:hypothetical protein
MHIPCGIHICETQGSTALSYKRTSSGYKSWLEDPADFQSKRFRPHNLAGVLVALIATGVAFERVASDREAKP